MRTISQVAELTGISIRTLQYYDEALQKLQQILFFKELGFKLKDIRDILEKPDFDRIAAFRKQKELLLLKRNRTNRLIQLLSRLEKGEQCMSFKEFDLSDYIHALEDFKSNQTEEIVKNWGSVENFDLFIQKIKNDEENVAKLAIQQFGSIEKYTESMKHNLEHFSEFMENWYAQIPEEMLVEDKFFKLASHRGENVSSDSIQNIVQEIIANVYGNPGTAALVGTDDSYCRMIIDLYSNDYLKTVTDTKYGAGSCNYIAEAFRYHLQKSENK